MYYKGVLHIPYLWESSYTIVLLGISVNILFEISMQDQHDTIQNSPKVTVYKNQS